MEIRFKAKPWWTGSSFVVTIPKAYIENGLLKEEDEHEFVVEASEGGEKVEPVKPKRT